MSLTGSGRGAFLCNVILVLQATSVCVLFFSYLRIQASQISLTVAQAFDVALKEYKKTLGPGKEKISKQMETAQTQVSTLAFYCVGRRLKIQ